MLRLSAPHAGAVLLPPSAARVIRLIALAAAMLLAVPTVTSGNPPFPAAAAVPTAEATTPAAPAAQPGWAWPIAAPHPIARAYSAPATRWSAGHRGIDIAAASGSIVRAPTDGEVHFAGVVVDRPVLSIRHSDGLVSSYEPVTTTLVAGDTVRRGDAIGEVAPATTHCDRDCLHFGVRLHGEYVSPLKYLGGIPRSVLLPTRAVRQAL